ncbi:MAG TPA: TolC family protein, partial [Pseudomonadales bacterium]
VPLYSGGAVGAQRRQAWASFEQARETMIGTERAITQQTCSQYIAVATQIQKVAAHQQAIVSAQSALDAIQAGYNVGTRNIVDVLNAQRNLFAAQRDYGNSRYDYILSMLDLKYLAGALTPDDIAALNTWIVPAETTESL